MDSPMVAQADGSIVCFVHSKEDVTRLWKNNERERVREGRGREREKNGEGEREREEKRRKMS